jgi:hypothetical protein
LAKEDHEKSWLSINDGLFSGIVFDDSLFMSKQQANTVTSGGYSKKFGFNDGFSRSYKYKIAIPSKNMNESDYEYHNEYIKPIHAVMMIACKANPDDSLQAILLAQNEVKYYTHLGRKALEKKYPDHYVWFVSPSETLAYDYPLFGKPPKTPAPSYYRILEQIRFINGDLKALAHQKEGFTWLAEDTAKKMAFLEQHIMPYFPEEMGSYPLLAAKIEELGLCKSASIDEEAQRQNLITQEKKPSISPLSQNNFFTQSTLYLDKTGSLSDDNNGELKIIDESRELDEELDGELEELIRLELSSSYFSLD